MSNTIHQPLLKLRLFRPQILPLPMRFAPTTRLPGTLSSPAASSPDLDRDSSQPTQRLERKHLPPRTRPPPLALEHKSRHPRDDADLAYRVALRGGEGSKPRGDGMLRFEAKGIEAEGQQAGFGMQSAAGGEQGEEMRRGCGVQDAGGEAKGRVAAPAVYVEDLAAERVVVDGIA
ncbi:hypothetical protein ACEQ8H_000704 [Pleosporales sp. CAS-2024a]